MFIRGRQTTAGRATYQAIETFRDKGGAVCQRIIANLGPCARPADGALYWLSELNLRESYLRRKREQSGPRPRRKVIAEATRMRDRAHSELERILPLLAGKHVRDVNAKAARPGAYYLLAMDDETARAIVWPIET